MRGAAAFINMAGGVHVLHVPVDQEGRMRIEFWGDSRMSDPMLDYESQRYRPPASMLGVFSLVFGICPWVGMLISFFEKISILRAPDIIYICVGCYAPELAVAVAVISILNGGTDRRYGFICAVSAGVYLLVVLIPIFR
jgi:hypothetical protein